jgi:YggT family protein
MGYIAYFINIAIEILILMVIIHVLLGYLMPDEKQPVRAFLARIIEPLLTPIRRLLPSTGAFDFSPVALILILIVLQSIISAIFRSFR